MSSTKERIAGSVFFLSTVASAAMILAILGFMVVLGIPLFEAGGFPDIWTGPWAPQKGLYGIWPMLSGTLWVALLATAFCLPVSLGVSFVIAGLGGPRLRTVLGGLVRFMTGIPTVVYGFVGIFLLVPMVREGIGGAGMCVLTAGMMLALLISPTMILFFTGSLLAVEPSYVNAARALGANRVQRLLYVMVPRATGGLAAGIVLSLGRAMGDTLIALMLAGNAIQAPGGLLEPGRTLTAHIALVKAADFDSLEFRSIFACGIVLYLIAAIATAAVRRMTQKKEVLS